MMNPISRIHGSIKQRMLDASKKCTATCKKVSSLNIIQDFLDAAIKQDWLYNIPNSHVTKVTNPFYVNDLNVMVLNSLAMDSFVIHAE